MRTVTEPRRRPRTKALVLGVALLTVLVPPAANVAAAVRDDWRASPRFDGDAYVVSEADAVAQVADPTGVAAVIATFDRWRGGDATEASVVEAIEENGFRYRLADFEELAAAYGLDGRWVETETAGLSRLKTPFVAHLADGGGRFVIVRHVALGHVYATDPTRGNALYPLDRFVETWTGRAFAFPDPPDAPEAWR